MGTICCTNTKSYKLKKIVVILNKTRYDLPEIPESFESLQQSVLILAAKHFQDISPLDYFEIKVPSAKDEEHKFIRDEEGFSKIKSSSKKQILELSIHKLSFSELFYLDFYQDSSEEVNQKIESLKELISDFKEYIEEFLRSYWKLVKFTARLSLLTTYSSLDSIILALLACFACDSGGDLKNLELEISTQYPYLELSSNNLSEFSIKLKDLWESFIRTLVKAIEGSKLIEERSKEILYLLKMFWSKRKNTETSWNIEKVSKILKKAIDLYNRTKSIRKQLGDSIQRLKRQENGEWLNKICSFIDISNTSVNELKILFGLRTFQLWTINFEND